MGPSKVFHRKRVGMAWSRSIVLLSLALPAIARAEDASPPVLVRLSQETQSLYQRTREGVVRLQLPTPKWLGEAAGNDNPVEKWAPELSSAVKQKLEHDRQGARQGKYNVVNARLTPTTQPGTTTPSPPAWRAARDAGDNTIILQPNGDGASIQIQTGGEVKDGHLVPGGAAKISLQPSAGFAPNNIGLVFDDAGHVLVPLCLEKETVGDGVFASVGAGPVVNATFVASDRQANITILQLPPKVGKPVRLGESAPAEGALVMLLAPGGASARLIVWAAGQRDVAGVVVDVEGSVSGFARYGQFLRASACKPVVEQLVLNGKVKRSALGVLVREVPANDPLRDREPALGVRPALRVEEVAPRSAAAKGDLRVGDLIMSVAGDPVGDPSSFAVAISNRTGDTPMQVLRAGQPMELSIELKAE